MSCWRESGGSNTRRMRGGRAVSAAALWLGIASVALAQKAPELGYVYPPTVRAGHSNVVQLGGYDFTPDVQFFVHHDRVSISVTVPLLALEAHR